MPVLLVGESATRSFLMALALMRRSPQGLYGTSLGPYKPKTLQEMLNALEQRLDFSSGTPFRQMVPTNFFRIPYLEEVRFAYETFKKNVSSSNGAGDLKQLFLKADATSLQTFLDASKVDLPSLAKSTSNIWFQCPWCSRGRVHELLRSS